MKNIKSISHSVFLIILSLIFLGCAVGTTKVPAGYKEVITHFEFLT